MRKVNDVLKPYAIQLASNQVQDLLDSDGTGGF